MSEQPIQSVNLSAEQARPAVVAEAVPPTTVALGEVALTTVSQPQLTEQDITRMTRERGGIPPSAKDIEYMNMARARGLHHG